MLAGGCNPENEASRSEAALEALASPVSSADKILDTLLPLPRERLALLRGRVVDDLQRPISGAKLAISGQTAWTLQDGSWELSQVPLRVLTSGTVDDTVSFGIEAPQHTSADTRIRVYPLADGTGSESNGWAGESGAVRLKRLAVTLQGTLKTIQGTPIGQITLSLRPSDFRLPALEVGMVRYAYVPRSVTTAADGAFVFDQVAVDTDYDLQITSPGWERLNPAAWRVPVRQTEFVRLALTAQPTAAP